MTGRARIVRATEGATPLFESVASEATCRRIAREEIEAREVAERLVRQARADAQAIVDRASADAATEVHRAAREAEEAARAREVARWLILRGEEDRTLERDRDRLVAIAMALAERLLGAALELDPTRVASLTRKALDEARGARRIVIEANPLDAAVLREHLSSVGLDGQSLEIRESSPLARGDLLLHTDVGIIDARVAIRFERLAAALRNAVE